MNRHPIRLATTASHIHRLAAYLLVACALLLAPAPGNAEGAKDHATSLTYLSEDFPPYNYVVGGMPDGLAVKTLHLMWENMGLPPKDISFLPWSRAYDMALNRPGHVLFTTGHTPERSHLFKWVGPLEDTRIIMFALRERGIRINSPADFKGMSIGVVKGYAAESILTRHPGLRRVDSLPCTTLHVKKLVSGRVDLIALEERSFWRAVNKLQLDRNMFEEVWVLRNLTPCYAFSKDTPDSVITMFQKAFDAVTSAPGYSQLIDHYLD